MTLERLCDRLGISEHIGNLKAWHQSQINSVAATLKAEHEHAFSDYKNRVEVAKAAIIAAAIDPSVDTVQAISAIIAEGEKPEAQKRKEALAAEIAAKQAEYDSIK